MKSKQAALELPLNQFKTLLANETEIRSQDGFVHVEQIETRQTPNVNSQIVTTASRQSELTDSEMEDLFTSTLEDFSVVY